MLLLDEPTASLDAGNRAVVIGLIEEAKRAGSAIIGIFHDTEVRDQVADRLFEVTAHAGGRMKETILTNARLVLPAEVVAGTIVLRGDRIAEVQPGRSHLRGAEDLDGDHLIPGVVDVHTDNLERQVLPRANARWPQPLRHAGA